MNSNPSLAILTVLTRHYSVQNLDRPGTQAACLPEQKQTVRTD
jgi:hypothetical protein